MRIRFVRPDRSNLRPSCSFGGIGLLKSKRSQESVFVLSSNVLSVLYAKRSTFWLESEQTVEDDCATEWLRASQNNNQIRLWKYNFPPVRNLQVMDVIDRSSSNSLRYP